MQLLKQSTAASTIVGPILDSTGAEYNSAVIGDISLSKNGGTLTALASAATLTNIANGLYTLAMTTGNTDTLGRAEIFCNKVTYQMPPVRFEVLAATTFDAIVTNAAGAANGIPICGSNAATTFAGLTTGALSCTTITASGAVAFQSTFAVTTSTSLAALSATTITASGTTSLAAVTTSGTVTLNALTVTNNFLVSGTTTHTGAVTNTAGLVSNITGNLSGSVGSVGTGGITNASLAADTGLKPIRSATAAAGAATTLTLDGSANGTTDGFYNNAVCLLTGGTGAGQVAVIINYVASTKVATVSPSWLVTPDNTSTFALLPSGIAADGTATAGAASTITLANILSTSATNDVYNGRSITIVGGTGIGQSNVVLSYVGSTRVATMVKAWTTTPDSTSQYVIGTAIDAAEQVWNAVAASYNVASSMGAKLNSAASAGDPWSTALPGAYAAGTAGHIVGTALPDIAPGSANGLLRGGTNTATTLAALTVTGVAAFSDALTVAKGVAITNSTSNGAGLAITGNGTGAGLSVTSGSGANAAATLFAAVGTGNSHALSLTATAGIGLSVSAASHGISVGSSGAGDAMQLIAGSTGIGLKVLGGSTSGVGIAVTTTSGDGLSITPTAGSAIVATANGTSKHGFVITGGTAGTSDGVKAVAGTGGVDIRGAITGNITGALSGAVGSVTGAVGSVTGAVGSVTAAVTVSGTSAMTESYAAPTAAFTLAQGLYEICQMLHEISYSSTTGTVKKRDQSTTAYTVTLDSATAPTSITRAT